MISKDKIRFLIAVLATVIAALCLFLELVKPVHKAPVLRLKWNAPEINP
jgi:hypothetical protein